MLIQQVQLIGGGAHGSEAAEAIRRAAAHNGVWSLGGFEASQSSAAAAGPVGETSAAAAATADAAGPAVTHVDSADYKCIFNMSGVGMAVASMGGAFMDCNSLFSRLTNYSRQELCALTIFNLTARNDLQRSFDLISRMISPPVAGCEEPPRQVVLRGSMVHRSDLGMSISLVKGDDGIAKCFCVTLVKNPTSPFDTSKPTPVSYESILPQPGAVATEKEPSSVLGVNQSPAATFG
jgi:PAS domain S-box-containing protein